MWRQPPNGMSPLPRFTTMSACDKLQICLRMSEVATELCRALAPGWHVILAANPLLSSRLFSAIAESSFDMRGEVVRIVRTLRGDDRSKKLLGVNIRTSQ